MTSLGSGACIFLAITINNWGTTRRPRKLEEGLQRLVALRDHPDRNATVNFSQSGKEHTAMAMHKNAGAKSKGPCTNLPERTVASRLGMMPLKVWNVTGRSWHTKEASTTQSFGILNETLLYALNSIWPRKSTFLVRSKLPRLISRYTYNWIAQFEICLNMSATWFKTILPRNGNFLARSTWKLHRIRWRNTCTTLVVITIHCGMLVIRGVVLYCSKVHQKQDWKNGRLSHKVMCPLLKRWCHTKKKMSEDECDELFSDFFD